MEVEEVLMRDIDLTETGVRETEKHPDVIRVIVTEEIEETGIPETRDEGVEIEVEIRLKEEVGVQETGDQIEETDQIVVTEGIV